jgi:hypothetical protein
MPSLRLIIARNAEQLADAESVRRKVYCEEERLLPSSWTEPGGDRLELTEHTRRLLVYAGEEPVGTVRLNVARSVGHAANRSGSPRVGLALESQFVLNGFNRPGLVLAEVTGYCVLRQFRCTSVTPALFGALWNESVRLGVTHWVAAANMETDCAEDAAIAEQLIRARHLVSTDFGAHARSPESPPARATRFVYSGEQRERAARGDFSRLKLPRTLALFATKMGARYIGFPAYDRHFNVFAAPLAVTLSERDLPPAAARALVSTCCES